jgi:capsular polysaccharide transport system permease protein
MISTWQPPSQSLAAAFRAQWNVIVALMLREAISRFKHQRLGYLWAIFDPLTQIAIWFVIFTALHAPRQIADMPPAVFLATGIVPFFFFSDIASYVSKAVGSNRALLRFPMVKQLDAILARFILESSTMVIMAVVVFAIILTLNSAAFPEDWIGILATSLGMLLLGLGFGAFNTMIILLAPSYEKVQRVLNQILFFTSGAIIPLASLPHSLKEILLWNPLLNGVERFRSSWSHTYDNTDVSNAYVFLWAGLLFAIALLLDKRVSQTDE